MNSFCPLPESETFFPDIFPPEPEVVVADKVWHCTASQQQGLSRLNQLADVYSHVGDIKLAGFRPACSRVLILGASGSGKTALAREFARQRGLPILTVEAGGWIVNGAAASKLATLRLVRDFVRSCSPQTDELCGIVYADELCKLLPKGDAVAQNGWTQSVFSEAISLLSADERLLTHDWTIADCRRLQNNFMVLGAGAFALALDEVRHASRRGSLGFTKKDAGQANLTVLKSIQEFLPEEILSRFSRDPIILQTPSRSEFREAMLRIHCELGIARTRPLEDLLDEAESAQGGFRWAESYLCELLIQHPYVAQRYKRNKKPEPVPAVAYDVTGQDFVQQARLVSEHGSKLRTLLGLIYARLVALNLSDEGVLTYRELLRDADLGTTLVEAIRVCGRNRVTVNDRDEIEPLSTWCQKAWQGLLEHGPALATSGILNQWVEAWSLSGDIVELRIKLSAAAQRGQLG